MTLKQFLYLATGAGIAYLLFIVLAPYYPLVAWPLIIISALLGVAFAFLPIGSRPLDHWVKAFLKAVYSPTQRGWKKNGQTFKDNPLFNSRLVMYTSTPPPATPKVETPKPPPVPQPTVLTPKAVQTPQPLPTADELGKTVDLARQAQNLQIRILQTERVLNQIKAEAQQPTAIPVDYSEQVSKVMSDLQNLVAKASQTKQQLDQLTKSEKPPETVVPKEKIKVVVPPKTKQTQLALTTFPNVINGIVKDKNGNYLEGAIAVIYDKEGLPVRALKTNKLGQFSGSTPLPNGTYNLEFEKDAYNFDVLQIELTGGVLPPLMITAKN